MVFIVKYLDENKDILKCETVTHIIKYFKENKNYKFPNFLREELKHGNDVSFRIGKESYYIRVE